MPKSWSALCRGWVALAVFSLVPFSVAAMESVAKGGEEFQRPRFLHGALLFALILAISHIASPWIQRRFARYQRIAVSFGGGMAIAYVFAHLLPELAAGDRLLGPKIFLIAFAGFVVYYGLQRFAETRVERALARGHEPPAFRLQLGFLFVYNWLIVYGAPQERMESTLGVVSIGIALWLHLVQSDSTLNQEYSKPFRAWGRYVLALAPILGWVSAVFLRSNSEAINDIFVALLAGTVLYNAFQDELPKGKDSSYPAFLVGALGFTSFVILSRLM